MQGVPKNVLMLLESNKRKVHFCIDIAVIMAGKTRALVGMWAMWAMAHPLFENLLNKGPFKIFFFKKFTSIGPPTFKMPPRALFGVEKW